MKSLKFLHFSDLHLDSPFTSLGNNPKVRGQRRQDLLDTFDRIINLAQREAVDVILISGDLYEHNHVRESTIHYINNRFRELRDIEIFIVPGNHDPAINNSYYKSFKWSKNTHILCEDKPQVYLRELDTVFFGAGFSGFYEKEFAFKVDEPLNEKKFNIMLVHATVDMDFGGESYNPVTGKQLASYGMDYIALGHFHNPSTKIGGYDFIYNPGSPEPLGFDERGKHGVFVGTISITPEGKRERDIKFVDISKRQYDILEISSDYFSSDTQIRKMIDSQSTWENPGDILLNVVLRGYTKRGYFIKIGEIEQMLRDKFFYVSITNETVPAYDYMKLSEDPGLVGLFVRKMLERINHSPNQREKHLLEKAMQYGVEALQQGKIDLL
ncbi:MAG: DNA repair exonuclease [Clostridium sp.]|nr:DNA repair exonuclease [Clostridium sp.]